MSNGQDDANVPPWRLLSQKRFEEAKKVEEEKRLEEEKQQPQSEEQTQPAERQTEPSSREPEPVSPPLSGSGPSFLSSPGHDSGPVNSPVRVAASPVQQSTDNRVPAPPVQQSTDGPPQELTDEELAMRLHAELNASNPTPSPPTAQFEPPSNFVESDEEMARRIQEFGDDFNPNSNQFDEDGIRAPDQAYRERLMMPSRSEMREREANEMRDAIEQSLGQVNTMHLRPTREELAEMINSDDPAIRQAASLQLEEGGYSPGNHLND
eukprot:Selendium_serpulae@DN2005_c0_g1_i10.p1